MDSLDLNATYSGTVPLWYRLLNCGCRLTASAGTDTFLNRIRSRVPGGDRVYVRIDGPLTCDVWIDGLRAGRTFVTSGPMLYLRAGGCEPGETLECDGGKKVRVVARATAQFPMDRLEVVANGHVVASMVAAGDRLSVVFDDVILVKTSGWIAVRVTGPPHRDLPTGRQYAHTSPVYVSVPGVPYDASADAAYFLKWIDRLHLALRVRDRIPSDALKLNVEAQLDAARQVCQNMLGASR